MAAVHFFTGCKVKMDFEMEMKTSDRAFVTSRA